MFSPTEWSGSYDDSFALVLAFADRVPRLADRYDWQAITHCHGGVRRDWTPTVAIELTPKPEAMDTLREIVERWHFSNLCDPALVLPDYRAAAEVSMAEYRAQLATLGVQWTGSSPSPQDALYPIDATQDALQKLALDPPQLWAMSQPNVSGNCVNPIILLLSANSD